MYKVLFTVEAEKTVESVQKAFLAETGDVEMGSQYDSIEVIERAEREGFLEFENGMMTVYADMP